MTSVAYFCIPRKLLVLFIFLCMLVLGTAWYEWKKYNNETLKPTSIDDLRELNIAEEKIKWLTFINKVGTEKAYVQFSELYKDKNYVVQHNMMHLMGGLVYSTEGIRGIGICDSSFDYACYHQFFIDFIREKGSFAVPQVIETCIQRHGEQAGFCIHGVGHGVQEFYGDTQEGLLKALKTCAGLTSVLSFSPSAVSQCNEGVFMQYNHVLPIQNMLVREVDPTDPLSPCNVISEEFKRDCYLSIARRWLLFYTGEYRQADIFCTLVPEQYKKFCYRGIGVDIAMSTNYDVEATEKTCYSLADEFGRSYCKVGAANLVKLQDKGDEFVNKICSGLQGETLKECFY